MPVQAHYFKGRETMTAKEVLETALEVVGGERASTHGSMLENHRNIAQLWNAYLFNKDELEASDVANMMELMKVARRKLGTLNRDDYVDGAGYAAVAYQCAEAGEDFTMTLDFGKDYDAINNVVFGPVKP
mgnify:CR=1 FL=1